MAEAEMHCAAGDFQYTEERNVIVVGKAGVGKSMMINQVVGQAVRKVSSTPDRTTTEIEAVTGIWEFEGKKYFLTLIDTIGFSDASKDKNFKDSKIINRIISKIKEKGTIHLIIFTHVDKEASTWGYNKQIWELFKSYFTDTLFSISAAVITNCEDYSEDHKEKLRQILLTDEKTKDYFSSMSKGIKLVGFPDTRHTKVKVDVEDMARDADEIRKLIANSDRPMITSDLIKKSCNIF